MNPRRILWASIVALFAIGIWAAYVYDLDAVYAYRGDSAIAWVYQSAHPELFPGTFADLTDSYGSSLAMRSYLWAYRIFGIAPENFYPVFLAGEILAIGAASWFLFRTLFPKSSPGACLFFVLLLVCSNARNMNLARFGQPLFFGIYYNYADAFRIAGVAWFLGGRNFFAYASMALSFACHPVMGLIGFGFLLIAQLFCDHGSRTTMPRRLGGPLLFALLAGAWVWATTDFSAMASSSIPRDRWFAMTRFGSYHWYPWDIGVFTAGHAEMLIPFLAFLLIAVFYWQRREQRTEADWIVLWGCLGLLCLVPVGVLASETEWSPMLVKLALHRSNDLVIVLGLCYVANGFWSEMREGAPWRKAYSCLLGAFPFYFPNPFSWIHSLLFTSPGFSFSPQNRRCFGLFLFAAALLALPFVYVLCGVRVPWSSASYLSNYWVWAILAGAVVLSWAMGRFARDGGRVLAGISSAVLFLSPIAWFYDYHQDRPFVGKRMDLAKSYKEAQLWAKESTPVDSLFMPDPTIFYGWKDFSRRSSFGNLRAWLFESWSYSSNAQAYEEGLRRFGEFGVELEPFTKMRPSIDGMHRLTEKIESLYYEFDDAWRSRMAERYGIDYFVYRKKKAPRSSLMPVAFENAEFLILQAKER